MGNITEYLNKIKNAVFGKDVRDSIIGAIETTYEDASKNGNANMEVSEARGGYDTLKKRLDGDKNNLQNQITVERARIDLINTLEDGSTTGDAELIDGRIGANGENYDNLGNSTRTQFQQINNNSIRKRDVKFIKGFINSTGKMENSSLIRCCSDLIKINGKIIVSMTTDDYGYALFYYNENKELISQQTSYTNGTVTTCITENQAKYIGIMLKHSANSNTEFSNDEVKELITYTNVYDFNVADDLKSDISMLNDENYDFKSFSSFSVGAFSTLNGAKETVTKTRLKLNNLIPIKRDFKLSFTNDTYNYLLFFFDKNKRLKSYINAYYNGTKETVIKTNDGSYLGIMIKIDNNSSTYTPALIEECNSSIKISKIKINTDTLVTNNLYQKTIIGLGDSLMYGNLLGNSFTWLNKLGEKNSMTYYNKGANGTPIGGTGDDWAMNRRIDAIVNEIQNCDYFVLEGGANDRRTNITLGTVNSTDRTTFTGGIRYIINKVREVYPKAKILLLTNYKRFPSNFNDQNLEDKDYVQAMINVAKDMCVPVFDNYHDLGLDMTNDNTCVWADEGINVGQTERNGHFSSEGYDWLLTKYETLLNNL